MRVGGWEMENLLREKNEEINQKYFKSRGVFKGT